MALKKAKRPTRDEFHLKELGERLVEVHQEETERPSWWSMKADLKAPGRPGAGTNLLLTVIYNTFSSQFFAVYIYNIKARHSGIGVIPTG